MLKAPKIISLAWLTLGCANEESMPETEPSNPESHKTQTGDPIHDEAEDDFAQSVDPGLPIVTSKPAVTLPEGKPIIRSCYDNEEESFAIGSTAIPNSAPPPSTAPSPRRGTGPSGSGAGMTPPSTSTGAKGPPGIIDSGPIADMGPPPQDRDFPPSSKPGAEIAWGQDFFLSNDDSMSLASAQRVLFALEQNRRIASSQIRPHELLNYFSFETANVQPEKTFSVAGGALKISDQTLSVALSVKGSHPEPTPLDLTIVVDRSGSMSSEGRMEYTKRALSLLTESLNRGDRVDIVLFDSDVCTPLEDWVAGRDKPALLEKAIEDMQPRGSTDLDMGLREGYRIATKRGNPDARNQRVMLITDAYLNTGNVDKDLLADVGKQIGRAHV